MKQSDVVPEPLKGGSMDDERVAGDCGCGETLRFDRQARVWRSRVGTPLSPPIAPVAEQRWPVHA